jgi:hypothetical protein
MGAHLDVTELATDPKTGRATVVDAWTTSDPKVIDHLKHAWETLRRAGERERLSYRPARELLGDSRSPLYRVKYDALRRGRRAGKVRTRPGGARRLSVHAGDWCAWLAQDRQTDRLLSGLPAEAAQKVLEELLALRAEAEERRRRAR